MRKAHVFALLPLLIIGGLLWYGKEAPRDVAVVLTERGFEPSRVYLREGDSIIFSSITNEPFWPASDSHPTHSSYPGFDPRRAVDSEDTWRFTFERSGVWGFHDHLNSSIKGKVIVEGEGEESIEKCLAGKIEDNSLRAECWEPALLNILNRQGINAAFDSIAGWYDGNPVFRRNCHDVMHLIGAAAYRDSSVDIEAGIRPETTYCGYGFYHGFVETMLIELGSGQFGPLKDYCDRLRETGNGNAYGACYHGIGHAIFDSLPSRLWGNAEEMVQESIKLCEKILTDPWERTQCVSGISNSLANAMSARDYYLTFTGPGSIDICASQKKEYRIVCYPELAVGYVRDEFMSREDSFKFFNVIQDPNVRGATILGFMDDEVRRKMALGLDLEELTSFCLARPVPSDASHCFTGILYGLFAVGKPGEEGTLISEFCELARNSEEGRRACEQYGEVQ